MNASILISITGTIISIVSVCYVVLAYQKNKGRLKISFDLLENGIRVYVFNVGHRPIGIQNVGYVSWSIGNFITRGGNQDFIVLNEGEVKIFEDQLFKDRSHIADIKNIGVRDVNGKIWCCDKYQVARLNEHIYMEPDENGYFTKKINSDSEGRKVIRNRKKSLRAYLKFIKKNKYKNKLKGRQGLHAADDFISDKILNHFK